MTETEAASSTTETPAATEIPAVPETKAVTEIPAVTETPAVQKNPAATAKPVPRKGVVATLEQEVIDAEQHIETWFHDLLASLPHLRETATYNHLRGAIDDLKKRIT